MLRKKNKKIGLVDAPILYDHNQAEYYKNPMYYTLAQFTRFLEPQATIVESELVFSIGDKKLEQFNYNDNKQSTMEVNSISDNLEALDCTNEENPDEQEIYLIAAERPNKSHFPVIVLNRSANEKVVKIQLDGKFILQDLAIGANSVTTIVLPAPR